MGERPTRRNSSLPSALAEHLTLDPVDVDRVKLGIIDSGFEVIQAAPNARLRAVFGKVTSGMDVVLAIQQGDVMESVDVHKK